MKLSKDKIKLAQQESWYRGNLTWKLHKGQKVINDLFNKMKGQLFVCNISRQFGKTVYSVIKAIEVAIQKPNSIIRYGTAFLVDLMRFIIPAFKLIMEDCPSPIKGKLVRQGGSAFIFPNGSRIDLVGIDRNPDAMRGNSLDLVVIDEAAYVSSLDYLFKSVIVPSTTHRPHCKILMVSSAPSSPDHDFKLYCDNADSYCKLTIYDHPTITEETIDRLASKVGGKDSTTFRREFLCEFVADSALQIIPEWKDEFIQDVPKDEFYNFYKKYAGMDMGYRDFTAVLFGYYDFKNSALVIEDELKFNGPEETTQTMSSKIKQKEKDIWGDIPPPNRIADNNNLTQLQDMSSIYNLSFTATTKESLEAMVNKVRIMVNAGRIMVNPRCEYLIGCLRSGIWDAKKTIFARSTKYGHFDHMAALIYLVRNLDTNSNPIPATHGFIKQNTFNYHVLDQDNMKRNLSKALIPKFKQPNSNFRR